MVAVLLGSLAVTCLGFSDEVETDPWGDDSWGEGGDAGTCRAAEHDCYPRTYLPDGMAHDAAGHRCVADR